MFSLYIHLLGKIQVYDSTQTPITLPLKAQELLVYLFIHYNQPHEREKLAVKLWPNYPEDRLKKYLRQALWQLQNSLNDMARPDDSILQIDGSWVQLNLTNCIWIDANQFNQAFKQVRDTPAQAMTATQVAAVTKAVELYRGELVTGWYYDWCLLEQERFQSMYLAMLDKLIDWCLANQEFERGTEYAIQTLRYDNARERSHRRLMRLYYLADNRTAALRQYERCAAILAKELNVQPSRKTIELYQHIQADENYDLLPLASPIVLSSTTKGETTSSVFALLQSIHTNLLALQDEMQSLKQALALAKDVSADV